MQTENLECQIAQAQMGRYLGGEGLSNEAIAQLEEHIRACGNCKDAIQERRRSLESVLALPTSEEFPALKASRKIDIKPASMPWVDAIRRVPQQPDTPEARRTARWRTPVYAGALIAVLFVMTTLTREPTRVFGDRAIDKLAKSEPTKVATNLLPPVETSGESPITLAEPKASYALDDFVPAYLVGAFKRFNPAITDKALNRQVMEIELQKMQTAKPEESTTVRRTSRRRSSSAVIRIYPIANAKGGKK